MVFALGVFLGALLLLLSLAAGTNVLRRAAKERSAAQGTPRTPLSLGRLQMAWWSGITLASFSLWPLTAIR
jgi:hypothetical protein